MLFQFCIKYSKYSMEDVQASLRVRSFIELNGPICGLFIGAKIGAWRPFIHLNSITPMPSVLLSLNKCPTRHEIRYLDSCSCHVLTCACHGHISFFMWSSSRIFSFELYSSLQLFVNKWTFVLTGSNYFPRPSRSEIIFYNRREKRNNDLYIGKWELFAVYASKDWN